MVLKTSCPVCSWYYYIIILHMPMTKKQFLLNHRFPQCIIRISIFIFYKFATIVKKKTTKPVPNKCNTSIAKNYFTRIQHTDKRSEHGIIFRHAYFLTKLNDKSYGMIARDRDFPLQWSLSFCVKCQTLSTNHKMDDL